MVINGIKQQPSRRSTEVININVKLFPPFDKHVKPDSFESTKRTQCGAVFCSRHQPHKTDSEFYVILTLRMVRGLAFRTTSVALVVAPIPADEGFFSDWSGGMVCNRACDTFNGPHWNIFIHIFSLPELFKHRNCIYAHRCTPARTVGRFIAPETVYRTIILPIN